MMARTQIALDPETQRRERERAADLGTSFAEYVRGLVERDLEPSWIRLDVHRAAALDDDFAVFRFGKNKGRAFEILR